MPDWLTLKDFSMFGIRIAFGNDKPGKGMLGNGWVGLERSVQFAHSPNSLAPPLSDHQRSCAAERSALRSPAFV